MTSLLNSWPAAALALSALLVFSGCRDSEPDSLEDSSLVGTWLLDAETREWLPRACVVLHFDDPARAMFDARMQDDDLVVRLRDSRQTTWRGAVRRERFEGQQVLPTTPTGRFCGSDTVVRLRLEMRNDEFRGVWETPNGDVCPDRHFGAQRVVAGAERTVPTAGR
jgi:hypothetical protein